MGRVELFSAGYDDPDESEYFPRVLFINLDKRDLCNNVFYLSISFNGIYLCYNIIFLPPIFICHILWVHTWIN